MQSSLQVPTRRFRRIVEAEAHHRLALASLVALVAFGIGFPFLKMLMCLIVAWNAFALSSLFLAWLGILLTDVRKRVTEARLQDSNRAAIGLCLVVASIAGLGGACVLFSQSKDLHGAEVIWHVALATLTVVSSWSLVHTILTLHYAHVFYGAFNSSKADDCGKGLEFPGDEPPDYFDFAYFSFVVGMTFQVSDVQVTSRRMRRLVLLHGLLSFAFNTVIVALSINLAATLL